MKRPLLALLPWMAIVATSYGQSRAAEVTYTHYGPLRESVFRVADECYAPIFSVEAWGWKVRLADGGAFLKVEGHDVYVPVRTVSGRQTIPLKVAFERLGADVKWEPGDKLVVRSPVEAVRVKNGQVTVLSRLEVKAVPFAAPDPSRYVIDLKGAVLLPDTPLDLDENAKVEQFGPDVVRISIQTPDADKFATTPIAPGNKLSITLGEKQAEPPPSIDPPPSDMAPSEEIEEQQDPASMALPPQQDLPPLTREPTLFVELESNAALLLGIRDFGELTEPVRFRKPDPASLEIVLPGAYLTLPKGFKLNTPSIVGTELIIEEDNTVLRLSLKRAMGAQVSATDDEITIQLLKPHIADGRLAGSLVVVDPGHGGQDQGAKAGGVLEKHLALTIAKLTAQELAKAGATVIMTRKTDVFIPLLDRAELANRNNADLFLSIHINANKVANTTSGTITFHHRGSQLSKLLAECIQAELAKVNGLPDLGAWSDGKIYDKGFSVLRNTRMPGVLIELGFLNHRRDRARMIQPDFHRKVAGAIVKGLRTFVGDAQE